MVQTHTTFCRATDRENGSTSRDQRYDIYNMKTKSPNETKKKDLFKMKRKREVNKYCYMYRKKYHDERWQIKSWAAFKIAIVILEDADDVIRHLDRV